MYLQASMVTLPSLYVDAGRQFCIVDTMHEVQDWTAHQLYFIITSIQNISHLHLVLCSAAGSITRSIIPQLKCMGIRQQSKANLNCHSLAPAPPEILVNNPSCHEC